MKIGLLVCDEVNVEYQAEFGNYPSMFQRLLPDYEIVPYYVFREEFPASINAHDVYVSTGSRRSVYEDLDWIHRAKLFLKDAYEAEKYFIGVCFGHQLMAEALGGKVEKATTGWCVGVHQFDLVETTDWMKPPKSPVHFLMMCQDQVVRLPPEGRRLGGNDACPNAIIQVGARFMSIQAHPEFTKAYDRMLMESRVERTGEAVVDKGIASLEMSLDTIIFQSWVREFLSELE
ncbi:MAG: amidotransferase [Bacteroidota bacterium]